MYLGRLRDRWRQPSTLLVCAAAWGVVACATLWTSSRANAAPQPFHRAYSTEARALGVAEDAVHSAGAVARRSPSAVAGRVRAGAQVHVRVAAAARAARRYETLAEPFSALRGRLPSPVERPVMLAGYGVRRRTQSPTHLPTTGLTYHVPLGAAVRAVAAGVVVETLFLDGWGGIVLVAHDREYMTVYGHLVSVDVAVGHRIEAGSLLGRGGNLSSDGLEEVFFEIRERGDPIDPMPWLRVRPAVPREAR